MSTWKTTLKVEKMPTSFMPITEGDISLGGDTVDVPILETTDTTTITIMDTPIFAVMDIITASFPLLAPLVPSVIAMRLSGGLS